MGALVSDPFADLWENGRLGRSITHREHVRISWVLLTEHGRDEGERRILAGTEPNCDAAGAGERFDEPLTRRWTEVIADAVARTPGADFDAFLPRTPSSSGAISSASPSGGRQSTASPESRRLPDAEARQALGLLVLDLDTVDPRPSRPRPAERDQAVDRVRLALEHGLDGAVPRVPNPARNPVLLCPLPQRVPEEHALDEAVGDDPRRRIIRARAVRARSAGSGRGPSPRTRRGGRRGRRPRSRACSRR